MSESAENRLRTLGVGQLKGAGKVIAGKLRAHLALTSLYDLLFHLPFRYQDRTRVTLIADLPREGGPFLVEGTVTGSGMAGSRVFRVSVTDDSGRPLEVAFFNYHPSFCARFTRHTRLALFGFMKPNTYLPAGTNMVHPEVQFLHKEHAELSERLTPVYHLTEGVSQRLMRSLTKQALKALRETPCAELLPAAHNPYGMSFNEALAALHEPLPAEDGKLPLPEELPAFKRLCLEEITAYQLSLLSLKHKSQKPPVMVLNFDADFNAKIRRAVPFSLTAAQQTVLSEIVSDLERPCAMTRLVQGDVGSGKTIVALWAAALICAQGGQCVLLAPTEILAAQHYKSALKLLQTLGLSCVLLTGDLKKKERQAILEDIASGKAQIIIGTHAVFSADVSYHQLTLVIFDEQHRFGIKQRLALLAKAPEGYSPHQLVMTATPIPRTLQLALYSDLDVSAITGLPPGRTPVITAVLPDTRLAEVIQRLKEAIHAGQQAYWICPLIESEEDGPLCSVTERLAYLKEQLPGISIGLMHGQLSTEENRAAMEAFLNQETPLLLATTIVEVGVDVPNATIMIIEGADRLGLSQLHQLRGRVGRGSRQSFCLLVYSDPLVNPICAERLKVMRNETDGFKIAAADLELRGPGDIVGTRQSGFDLFRIAEPSRDHELISAARACALDLREHAPDTASSLIGRWFPQYL